MPKSPSVTSLDRALVALAVLASKSAKLSPTEKTELRALGRKGAKSGNQGFGMADRARCIWLLRKAGPERLPSIEIPVRLKKLLKLDSGAAQPAAPAIRERPSVDPLDRLKTLGDLRGKPLTEAQFSAQRDLILADPLVASYGAGDDIDPLERRRRSAAQRASHELVEHTLLTPGP